jgi:hypothetical protein
VVASERLELAIARAIRFFAGSREPQALIWLEYMRRRFDIADFEGSLACFDEILTTRPQQAGRLRVLRRIADPGNRLQFEDLDGIDHVSDELIVVALYCDQLEVPAAYPDALVKAVGAGGYFCTHALLAWIWLCDRGAEAALPAGFADAVFDGNARVVNDGAATVTDLKLEAAAFLCMANQAARIDPEFFERVLRTQNPDGGWGTTREAPDRSDWHGTILGLLLLLQLRGHGPQPDGERA